MNERLQEQVDELGLLESMFASPGEFEVEDRESYQQAEAYLQKLAPRPPNSLSCKLCVPINAQQDSDEEEVGGGDAGAAVSPYSITISIRLPPRLAECMDTLFSAHLDLCTHARQLSRHVSRSARNCQ